MLHFRHFLIPTLMVGAALFLPGNAFAEKSDNNGKLHSQKEMVQTSEKTVNTAKQANLPKKAENGKAVGKPATVSEPASKSQAVVKQPSSNAAPNQAVSHQSVAATAKALPEQANGNAYGHSKGAKVEKIINAPGQMKKAAVQEKESGLKTEQLISNDEAEHSAESTVNDKVESTKLVHRDQPQEENLDISNSIKAAKFEPALPVPIEKGKVPSSKEELPAVDQAINPAQRSNNTGSSSNDRVSTGVNAIGYSDKWFEWNKYTEIKLVQPFYSRYALMNTQWVNAPPSPPPQEAPFFKNVYRS
ncbi:hypothetical protein [Bacillus sp. S3]|uniref:hypothetical protein n=1 Tax=Bacillus sp. S3 TaxID=486398 RepID=UPI0016805256|nr:hypothetical protein [Bacillus sp. S3]